MISMIMIPPGQASHRHASWATLRSPVNHRSPAVLVALIDALALTDEPMQAGGVVHGFDPQLREFTDADSLVRETSAAIEELVAAGHAPADVAVITWSGLERSPLAGEDVLAGVKTRRFSGHYAQDGQPIFSDGNLQLETLFRFKGQAADCIVVAGIDFEAWTDDVRRRLFVALTRARLKVSLVASTTASRLICERLE